MCRISGFLGLLTLILTAAGPASANICAFDIAPSATLLFPFVAVDYNNPIGGETTLISITNMSWEAQILHATLWSDFGEGLINFNILLTGYDMIRLDMGEILRTGRLPVTTWGPHTDDEGVQDRGPMSSANILHGATAPAMDPPAATNALGDRCPPTAQGYPGLYTTPIPQAYLNLFQEWLAASQTIPRFHSDDCIPPFGSPYIPDPVPWFETRDDSTSTWMYLTVDVVESCNLDFPDNMGYFVDQARTDNVLVGDTLWRSGNTVTAAPAVHIEADIDLAAVATNIIGTGLPMSFYARYAIPNNGVSDHREPLPTAWAMRYEGIATDFVSTSFLTWKGSTNQRLPIDMEPQGAQPLPPDELVATNCLAYTYYAWDEDENVVTVSAPAVEINQLPLVTQQVGAESFQMPGAQGWVLFAWPPANWTSAAVGPPDIWQTWMAAVVDYPGLGRVFQPATPAANSGCFSDQRWPHYSIDYDYVGPDGYHTSPGKSRRPQDLQRPR